VLTDLVLHYFAVADQLAVCALLKLVQMLVCLVQDILNLLSSLLQFLPYVLGCLQKLSFEDTDSFEKSVNISAIVVYPTVMVENCCVMSVCQLLKVLQTPIQALIDLILLSNCGLETVVHYLTQLVDHSLELSVFISLPAVLLLNLRKES
jgi:hypothetical protein